MGTTAHVLVVDGGASLVDQARQRIETLESKWSRFVGDSEVSRLNTGETFPVSEETWMLIQCSIAGWERTAGRFDPTVRVDSSDRAPRAAAPSPGCHHILTDAATRAVQLPAGVRIDPGGIGKGLAADLITTELVRAGAAGVLVSLGSRQSAPHTT